MDKRRIYLDHNASTPVAEEVLAAMAPFARERFGNPHTTHWAGKPGGDAIASARTQVAQAIGASDAEIAFTAGASESNNWAIKGAYFAHRGRGEHFVSSAIEHPSVRAALQWLVDRFAATVTFVGVDSSGRVRPAEVAAAITPRTILVSIMHANNETGVIQPIEAIAAIARARGVLMHCDAAQSLGKIPVDVERLGVDLLSLAGHKTYAPKGVGALYVREGVVIDPLIHGAGQELGRRAGTENVEWIVGFGKACEIAARYDASHIRELRDLMWSRLQAALGDDVRLFGHESENLPNTLNVGFRGVVGGELLARLDDIAATTGAACRTGKVTLSPTLAAMNVDPSYGMGAVRWSLGRSTTREEIEYAVKRVVQELGNLRSESPSAP